ncbi:hypothetical protein D3C72_1024560 [compost metagenome]
MELGRVVGRHAVVRGADDRHRAAGRQPLGVVVERGQLGREAAQLAGLGQLARQVFGGAEVGALQHQQRGAVARRLRLARGGLRRRGGRGCRLCVAARARGRVAQQRLDLEVLGLDRQRFLDLELVARVIDEVEALQDHAQREHRLLQGELPPDAGALAVAEGLEGVHRTLALGFAAEVVGVELVGVLAPDALVTVQRQRMHDDHVVLLDRVLAADLGVFLRAHRDRGRGRVQAQRFLQHLHHVLQPVDLRVGGLLRGVAAEHAVDLGLCLGHRLGVVQQEVDGERQQAAGGLVARDEEFDALVADHLVGELLAALLVHARDHVAQQVGLGGDVGAAGAPLLDDVFHHLVHVADVLALLRQLLLEHQLLERNAAPVLHRLQRAHHRIDERMEALAVERVEAVAEAAQADGVERERGHVAHHVHLFIEIEALPLGDQLPRDVQHHRVVGLHRALAEVGQQDVVRLGPRLLVRVGGEEAVRRGTQPAQCAARALVEARLFAQLVDQRGRRHHDHRHARHVEPVDAAEVLRDLPHVEHRRIGADGQQIADEGFLRRMGDRMERVLSCHGVPCCAFGMDPLRMSGMRIRSIPMAQGVGRTGFP